MKVKFCAPLFYSRFVPAEKPLVFRKATTIVASQNTCGFSLDKQKSLGSEEPRLFPSGDPNRFVTVTEGHDAERARDSIMPRSAAT